MVSNVFKTILDHLSSFNVMFVRLYLGLVLLFPTCEQIKGLELLLELLCDCFTSSWLQRLVNITK